MKRKKIRIGDLLVEARLISQGQLEEALAEQKRSGRKLGRLLVDNGYVDEYMLLELLARQLEIPFVDLRQQRVDADTVRLIPEIQARRYRAIALETTGNALLVGIADPTHLFAFDELARALKQPLELAVVSESELLRVFDTVYRKTSEISGFAAELKSELSARDTDLGEFAQSDELSEAPVVKLIGSLFEDALQMRASDIHIEPDESELRIRQRVDGLLHEQVMNEKRIASALVLRLKLMAGLDIAEKRMPQDGRFSIKVKGHDLDVRISTMPLQYGEGVVMRLLDQSAGCFELARLGMTPRLRARFERAIGHPHGMVLVTGPTGSGKTTTLYAGLNELNRPETKIITVEDPVEYRLPRVNQVQVNTDIGLTFARVLRTVLRQDPDIVLVGEMRDEETADIGLRAAMTGHLVLSTLHTNDAVSTVNRLLDMGARGYLLASALRAVVAQRLVRRVCEDCAGSVQPRPGQAAWLRSVLGRLPSAAGFRHGRGCSYCGDTGYRGRVGVYELLEMDDALGDALSREDSAGFMALARERLGSGSLAHGAIDLAIAGITPIDEAMRLTGSVDSGLADEADITATAAAEPAHAVGV